MRGHRRWRVNDVAFYGRAGKLQRIKRMGDFLHGGYGGEQHPATQWPIHEYIQYALMPRFNILTLDSTMTDREKGGFFASQDTDVGLDDDGDYFTWTLDEARTVLDPAEFNFASIYWDVGELGDMHHNPAKNVLHVKQTLVELAEQMGQTGDV